jgi:hypothetical protein
MMTECQGIHPDIYVGLLTYMSKMCRSSKPDEINPCTSGWSVTNGNLAED